MSQVIVRVKRRRDQVPASSLCIVEDDAPRTKKAATDPLLQAMGQLSTQEGNSAAGGSGGGLGRSIILRRITTMSTEQGNQMENVVSSIQEAPQPAVLDAASNPSSSLWITQSKTAFHSQAAGASFVVVDMSQVAMDTGEGGGDANTSNVGDSSSSNNNNNSNNSNNSNISNSPSIKRSPIRDPATRKLEAAIEKAMLTNDFNDLAFAILQGGNINTQRATPDALPGKTGSLPGGETALMAAASCGNVRMVDRLLSLGAKVSATDALGRTAMDLLKAAPARPASQEIALKLHSAALKVHRAANGASTEGSAEGEGDGEYEFDVYYGGSSSMQTDPHSVDTDIPVPLEGGNGIPAQPTSAWSGLSFATQPVVRVEGLRIGDDGLAEIELAYDSDWSDLGDDEDPDSNDERYHANDYPDEEEDDEELDSDVERHMGIGRADLDSENEEDERRLAGRPGKDKAQVKPQKQRGPFDEDSEDDDSEDEGDEDDGEGGTSRYQRQTIGRVVRPTIQGGDALAPQHSRDSIRALWGENEGNDDDDDDDEPGYEGIDRPGYTLRDRFSASGQGMGPMRAPAGTTAHQARLAKMHQASGMEFGAVPKEFATSGLAKYGMDLSDDDDEGAYYSEGRPAPGTLAYDPDDDDL